MKRTSLVYVAAASGVLATAHLAMAQAQPDKTPTRRASVLEPTQEAMTATGRSRFFVLEPGYQLVFQGRERGRTVDLVITVLDKTRRVDGVETRIVEERESADGALVEVSRNYYALGATTQNVYYFGEDVDIYEKGRITSHEGAWLAGVSGAQHGIAIPADSRIGDTYYQERAPKVAMDRGETVSLTENVSTPGGTFANCLKVKETTPLERFNVEYKYYAPDIGLVQDGALKLVRHGFAKLGR